MVLPDDAPNHSSHILIEFFMPNCRFCREFKDDWNLIVQESYALHNVDNNAPKKVEFFLINGIKEIELRRRYKINGFPSFVYLRPGTRGKEAVGYEQERTKENMQTWLAELIEKYDNDKFEEKTPE